ncbi:Mg2+ transporter protein CorA-like/Zinc transport protein ZntB [Penicillium cataractarum]|uniref:Mg2+ transporter protein CorA-like/Zinc transport protein ZntB n=1 Tax=Penicillium cataractarum TaxID=2100454 RepID=A0A9W9S614_9EURO|nr:Mg2+ transporter protein CorA-like/Zinc transport protein ZntB [Penicillium cataractarum]KAJ5370258.1 Mg2+ transporter protein CorA-like/Zinc transport protein ZntB [Penicillium cataractarum]
MLDAIVAEHKIDSSFWELPSCFYQRSDDIEEVFCVPYTLVRTASTIEHTDASESEISYTLRYPEYKESEDRWTIRQTGIYHQFDTTTSKSLFVLFNPTPRSSAQKEAERLLSDSPSIVTREPFWLHRLLFSIYTPAWRGYIGSLERRFLPIANTAFATFIEEPLRLSYDHLSTLSNLEIRFLQVPAMITSTTDVIDELCTIFEAISRPSIESQDLQNHRRKCLVNSRTATHLKDRVQTIAHLLADTLLLRDQVVAREQNKNIFQLNKSAVFITTLTLLYLPASFLGTFFGMNFFAMDQAENRIVGTPMVWIYVVASAVLTAFTFLFYYWLLHRDGSVFRKLVPKVPEWNIQALRRQWTNRMKGDVELQSYQL